MVLEIPLPIKNPRIKRYRLMPNFSKNGEIDFLVLFTKKEF